MCRPSYTQGYHDRDNDFYLAWDEISKTESGVEAYLDEWVYGLPDRAAYWEKLGKEVHQRGCRRAFFSNGQLWCLLGEVEMTEGLNCNPKELMVINAARLLRDQDVVFVRT